MSSKHAVLSSDHWLMLSHHDIFFHIKHRIIAGYVLR